MSEVRRLVPRSAAPVVSDVVDEDDSSATAGVGLWSWVPSRTLAKVSAGEDKERAVVGRALVAARAEAEVTIRGTPSVLHVVCQLCRKRS